MSCVQKPHCGEILSESFPDITLNAFKSNLKHMIYKVHYSHMSMQSILQLKEVACTHHKGAIKPKLL